MLLLVTCIYTECYTLRPPSMQALVTHRPTTALSRPFSTIALHRPATPSPCHTATPSHHHPSPHQYLVETYGAKLVLQKMKIKYLGYPDPDEEAAQSALRRGSNNPLHYPQPSSEVSPRDPAAGVPTATAYPATVAAPVIAHPVTGTKCPSCSPDPDKPNPNSPRLVSPTCPPPPPTPFIWGPDHSPDHLFLACLHAVFLPANTMDRQTGEDEQIRAHLSRVEEIRQQQRLRTMESLQNEVRDRGGLNPHPSPLTLHP